MPALAKNIQQSTDQDSKKVVSTEWSRQEGESVLWYNRFQRYMRLGPKRSLQAAVEQERSQITALKSPKEPQKKESTRQKKSSVTHLAPVPPAKPQVPGSWKAACKTWQWVERAKAYDEYVIDKWTQRHLDVMFQGQFTNTMGRVFALNALFETEQDMFNNNSSKMTFEQFNVAMARMQSILRDIRDEMQLYDEDVTRLALRVRATKQYKESFDKKEEGKKK